MGSKIDGTWGETWRETGPTPTSLPRTIEGRRIGAIHAPWNDRTMQERRNPTGSGSTDGSRGSDPRSSTANNACPTDRRSRSKERVSRPGDRSRGFFSGASLAHPTWLLNGTPLMERIHAYEPKKIFSVRWFFAMECTKRDQTSIPSSMRGDPTSIAG